MLDLQYICDHRDEVATNCQQRGVTVDLDQLIALAEQRRQQIAATDDIRREQNEIAGSIPKASKEDRPGLIERGKQLKLDVAERESQLKEVEQQLRELQSQIPNLTHPDAPIRGPARIPAP